MAFGESWMPAPVYRKEGKRSERTAIAEPAATPFMMKKRCEEWEGIYYFLQLITTFEHNDAVGGLCKRQGRGQSAETASDDEDSQCGAGLGLSLGAICRHV